MAGKKKYTLSKHLPTVPMSAAEAAMTTASKTTTKTELTPFADAFYRTMTETAKFAP